jgi:hypothetical protein
MPRVPQEPGPQNRPLSRDVKRGKLSERSRQRMRKFSIGERKAGRKPILNIPSHILEGLTHDERDFIYGY